MGDAEVARRASGKTIARREERKANAGVPFDFAQGGLLHYAADGETVRRSGRDDEIWVVVTKTR